MAMDTVTDTGAVIDVGVDTPLEADMNTDIWTQTWTLTRTGNEHQNFVYCMYCYNIIL